MEEGCDIFAFDATNCGLGLLKYNVLPQGLSISSSVAQRALDELFEDLEHEPHAGVAIYLDDLLFYSSDPNGDIKMAILRHHELLDKALGKLCAAGYMVNADKSKFFQTSTEWLGFRIGSGELKPLEDYMVKLYKCCTSCKSVGDVRRVIGLLGYYSRFVRHYATLAEPLTRLTKNDVPFAWGKEQEMAVKNILAQMSAPGAVLMLPDYAAARDEDPSSRRPFVMYTDASSVGAGGVLMQRARDGEMRVVAFESKTFSETQRRWNTTHREWFALQHCMLKWRPYLDGTTFLAYTDHSALIPVLNKKIFAHHWQMRWSLKLQEFSFTLRHVEGLANAVADAASRDENAPLLVINDGDAIRSIMSEHNSTKSSPSELVAESIGRFSEADKARAEFSREQLAVKEEEMQKRCDEKLGKFDTNFLIATPADAFKKPAQRSRLVFAQKYDPLVQKLLKSKESSRAPRIGDPALWRSGQVPKNCSLVQLRTLPSARETDRPEVVCSRRQMGDSRGRVAKSFALPPW